MRSTKHSRLRIFLESNRFRRIALSIIAVGVLSVIFSWGYYNHIRFELALVEQTRQQLSTIAQSEAQSIQEHLIDIERELSILADNLGGYGRPVPEGQQLHFTIEDAYKNAQPLVESIELVDPKGIVQFRSPMKEGAIGTDVSDFPDVRSMVRTHRTYISGLFRQPAGGYALSMLYPIGAEKNLSGFLRAVIPVDRIDKLLRHLDQGDRGYAILLEGNGAILSYPDSSYIGKDIQSAFNKRVPKEQLTGFMGLIERMRQGEEGWGVVQFLCAGYRPELENAVFAFVPIKLFNDLWSIAVAVDYDALMPMVNKNTLYSAIFTGFVVLVLVILGVRLYRIQRKKDELEIMEATLKIINRQLHIQVGQKKAIEKELAKIKVGKKKTDS